MELQMICFQDSQAESSDIYHDLSRVVSRALRNNIDVKIWHPKSIAERNAPPSGNLCAFLVLKDESVDGLGRDDERGFVGGGGGGDGGEGVEIVSPVMRKRAWEKVVPALLRVIKKSHLKTGFNETTGLHIHVGRGDKGFTLQQLQRIAKAVILREEDLDEHHDHTRQEGPYFDSNRNNRVLKNLSDLEALRLIDAQTTLDGLLWIINPHVTYDGRSNKYYKYNFTCIKTWKTIEFRQKLSTLRSGDVLEWINTVLDFILTAVYTPDKEFEKYALLDKTTFKKVPVKAKKRKSMNSSSTAEEVANSLKDPEWVEVVYFGEHVLARLKQPLLLLPLEITTTVFDGLSGDGVEIDGESPPPLTPTDPSPSPSSTLGLGLELSTPTEITFLEERNVLEGRAGRTAVLERLLKKKRAIKAAADLPK